MLKIDFGKIEFKGSRIVLMSELTALMCTLLRKGVVDEDELQECVKMALNPPSNEDIDKVKAKYDSLIKFLIEVFED